MKINRPYSELQSIFKIISILSRIPKSNLTFGLRYAMNVFLAEIKIFLENKRNLPKARIYGKKKNLKLHIGCGDNYKRGWVNIDSGNNCDLSIDLREKLPFKDNSCKFIHAEHFLEHLEYPEIALSFLSEAYRVLAPNGSIRLGVPDSQYPLKAYSNKKYKKYFKIAKAKWHPAHCTTKLEHINFHFRNYYYPAEGFYLNQHKYAYDFETLKKILKKASFIKISKSSFNYKLDKKKWKDKFCTLYVTAEKKCSTKAYKRN